MSSQTDSKGGDFLKMLGVGALGAVLGAAGYAAFHKLRGKGHHHHEHGRGHGHGHAHGEERIESEEPSHESAADGRTAVNIDDHKADIPRDAIKADQESAFAMMQKELKPLSDQFVAFVSERYAFPPAALARLSRLFEYNLSGGKCLRGIFVINTTRYLCQRYKHLKWGALKKKAIVLAWCIEILQASFLVADDIMDGSTTRRGKPCWYKLKDVGLDGVNDSLILESFIYFLLEKYFAKAAIELELIKLYHEVALQTQLGQMLDLTSNPQGDWDPELLDTFNMDVYKRIVRFKTAYYSFFLPVASACILCGVRSSRAIGVVRDICVEIGEKFQIQDDVLDCFGDERMIGKIGTDIQDHKCSWLLVIVLRKCSRAQRTIIENNYGRHDEASVATIKSLYKELDVLSAYDEQERTSYERIAKQIDEADREGLVPRAILQSLLVLIHKRQK